MTNTKNDSHGSAFYIVDFDRTLADSDKLLEVFMEVADEFFEIPSEQIKRADADVKARGDSFDTASFVRDYLHEHGEGGKWQELEKQFIHQSRSLNMLLPGAVELLDHLRSTGEGYGILTYGNPLWQHLKLAAAGFNHVNRIVMEQKEKGKLITSWRQPNGQFILPQEFGGSHVDRIVMFDDKAVSFNSFPPAPSQGYQVVDPARILPSQAGEVPDNVIQAPNLGQAKQLAFGSS